MFLVIMVPLCLHNWAPQYVMNSFHTQDSFVFTLTSYNSGGITIIDITNPESLAYCVYHPEPMDDEMDDLELNILAILNFNSCP